MKKTRLSALASKRRKQASQIAKIALQLSLVTLSAPMMAQAEEIVTPSSQESTKVQRKTYNISKQPLYSALSALAEQAGIQFTYSAELVKNINSPGVQGQYTPDEALQKILSGTSISSRRTGSNSITLEKLVVLAPESATTLSIVNVVGKTNQNLSDPYNKDYAVTNATTATKTDTPIMQTPVSVQVVPRAVMDDQQVISVMDALRNVSGAQAASGQYNDNFMLRGFDATTTYRDGLRQSQTTNYETANLERIEVLKGPASVLFGRAEPGGIQNLVTKKPLDTPYYSLQQQFGSFDLYRTTVDATGPIKNDKTLLYRMNLAYKTNNSFRDTVHQDHIFFAPSVTWRPTDRFETNLNLEYQHDEFPAQGGGAAVIPAIGNRPASIPINTYLGDPVLDANKPNKQDKILLGFNWAYKFTDNWKVQNRFQYINNDWQQTVLTGTLQPDNRTIKDTRYFSTPITRDTYATNFDLTGKFETGFLNHDVLAGFDYMLQSSKEGGGFSGVITGLSNLDIYNPFYATTNLNLLNKLTSTNNRYLQSDDQWNGVYFQDHISFWDNKLHVLGGGRQDWASVSSGTSTGTTASFANIPTITTNNGHFSPRVGVVYQPLQWVSLYANYIESFGSNNAGASVTGTPFAPQIAEQHEAGVKTEFFDKRMTTTLAFFDITKSNVLAPIPGTTFSDVIGEVQSKGIEFDIAGQLTKSWNVMANYANTDAFVSKDNSTTLAGAGNQGHSLYSVARNTGNVWSKYQFNEGVLDGFNFGTGVTVASSKQGDLANTFQLPGWGRWDASVGYVFKNGPKGSRISTQLNVYNLLDKTYYLGSSGRNNIQPGQPLTLLGSVRIEF